jgi:hypothetical protein
MKFYQTVPKLLAGDRETGDLISVLSFLESRLKTTNIWEQHLQIKIVFMKRLRAD